MPKLIVGTLTAAIFMSLLTTGIARAQEKASEESSIQIKVSTSAPDYSARFLTMNKFKEMIESRFGKRVSVSVSHSASGYKEGEDMEALSFDLVNIIVPSSTRVAKQYSVKELYLFDLPYLFRKPDDVLKFLKSDSSKELLTKINKSNPIVEPLGLWPGGFRVFLSSKEIGYVESFQNVDVRVETKDSVGSLYLTALGMSPLREMNSDQLLSALKKESISNPTVVELEPSVIVGDGFNSYYKNLTKSEHSVTSYVVLTNSRWFNKLPLDVKTGIKEIIQDLGKYHLSASIDNNQVAWKQLQDLGIVVTNWDKKEKSVFVNKAVKAHEGYLKNINDQFLQEVYKTVR